jgi:anti-anti-sigma factor
MSIISREENNFIIVEAEGRLDAATAPAFESDVAALFADQPPKLLLDLTKLDYISSAGLRVILSLTKKSKAAKGSLALCNVTGLVREVIELSGFDNFLPIFETVVAAMDAQA